ncbi:Preprotein translocase subunit SecG [Candidatus Hepatincolaceae symbiont of Richtersius coronifer]
MITFLYVLQFIITILLIVLVVFQKSEGGTSLISSNQYNSFFANKSLVSNPLTRITIILGFAFFVNSIIIGGIHLRKSTTPSNLIEKIESVNKEPPLTITDSTNDSAQSSAVEKNKPTLLEVPLAN